MNVFAYNDSCIDLFLLQNGKKNHYIFSYFLHSWEFKSQLYRTEKISKSADSHIKRERLTQLINQQNCCWWIIQTCSTTDHATQFWGTFSAAWYFLSATFWRHLFYPLRSFHITSYFADCNHQSQNMKTESNNWLGLQSVFEYTHMIYIHITLTRTFVTWVRLISNTFTEELFKWVTFTFTEVMI